MMLQADREMACHWIERTVAGGQVVVGIATGAPCDRSSAVRRLAARAVASICPDLAGRVRIATSAPSGRPLGMDGGAVAPVSVSLAHVAGMHVACASTTHPVGIDVVSTTQAETSLPGRDRGLEWCFTASERRLIAAGVLSLRAAWAAKEAAYKAASIDVPFRPRLIEIESRDGAWWTWRLGDRWHTAAGYGWLITLAHHTIAVALNHDRSHPWPAGATP